MARCQQALVAILAACRAASTGPRLHGTRPFMALIAVGRRSEDDVTPSDNDTTR